MSKAGLLLLVMVACMSSCYRIGYDCRQYAEKGNSGKTLAVIEFKSRGEYDRFLNQIDTVFLDDSTMVFWDCAMSK